MTARTVAAIASVCAGLATAGCMAFYEIPVEIPIQAKIDISSFQRVLVAGFLPGGTNSIDPNTETARLLRSQLRSKQDLRVIDAEAISLVDEVDKRRAGDTSGSTTATSAKKDDPKIKTEQDLASYQEIFKDTEFWKKLGAQYESPLIVTGSVMFTEVAKSGMATTPTGVVDSSGVERFQTVRQYVDQKGYALSPTFIFIDGRTGAQLYTESYHEETYYPSGQATMALSSYYELMDKLLPSFLNTLSTQKIKGSRILLK